MFLIPIVADVDLTGIAEVASVIFAILGQFGLLIWILARQQSATQQHGQRMDKMDHDAEKALASVNDKIEETAAYAEQRIGEVENRAVSRINSLELHRDEIGKRLGDLEGKVNTAVEILKRVESRLP